MRQRGLAEALHNRLVVQARTCMQGCKCCGTNTNRVTCKCKQAVQTRTGRVYIQKQGLQVLQCIQEHAGLQVLLSLSHLYMKCVGDQKWNIQGGQVIIAQGGVQGGIGGVQGNVNVGGKGNTAPGMTIMCVHVLCEPGIGPETRFTTRRAVTT
jgi:hypothetical protein